MQDEILTYREMCDRENVQTLQRGMNYRLSGGCSVILMSQRSNAPYRDTILEDGRTIIYEGHDVARTSEIENPKAYDQPRYTKTGALTQNGHFAKAVDQFKSGAPVELTKVYEKLFSGIWSYKGLFQLIDYTYESDGLRKVFRFVLKLSEEQGFATNHGLPTRKRLIPTEVKKVVWERDKGRCVICGATDELHFDHDIPYSKGGTSITADNVRILCARHNLEKSDKIE